MSRQASVLSPLVWVGVRSGGDFEPAASAGRLFGVDQRPFRYKLPRTARIRLRREFDRVFQARNRVSDDRLTLYVARTTGDQARLGIAASRRLGNAVARNRIKRLIREAFRHLRPDLPTGTDWIVVPKPCAEWSLTLVRDSLCRMIARLRKRL